MDPRLRFPFESTTYPKLVINCDGSWEITEAPPEVFLGWGYNWCVIDPYCAVAWDGRSAMPVNEYWRKNHPRDDLRLFCGTIVLFRHCGALEIKDLNRVHALGAAKFSALKDKK